MKTIKKLLLATAATGLAAMSALAVGCGGDDTTVTPVDAGNHDVTVADTATADTNTPADTGTTDTGTKDAGPDAPVLATGQIDRMGRPAISTALNFGKDPDKDAYNQVATYHGSTTPFAAWAADTTSNANFNGFLIAYDTLGGLAGDGGADPVDWPLSDAGVHPLRDPLKFDVLIMDTSKDCTVANGYCETGYLEIEAQLLLGGAAHVTCGGRTLIEDVMSKTLTLLITKGRAAVSDNVAAATKAPTHVFPYLAAPN